MRNSTNHFYQLQNAVANWRDTANTAGPELSDVKQTERDLLRFLCLIPPTQLIETGQETPHTLLDDTNQLYNQLYSLNLANHENTVSAHVNISSRPQRKTGPSIIALFFWAAVMPLAISLRMDPMNAHLTVGRKMNTVILDRVLEAV